MSETVMPMESTAMTVGVRVWGLGAGGCWATTGERMAPGMNERARIVETSIACSRNLAVIGMVLCLFRGAPSQGNRIGNSLSLSLSGAALVHRLDVIHQAEEAFGQGRMDVDRPLEN